MYTTGSKFRCIPHEFKRNDPSKSKTYMIAGYSAFTSRIYYVIDTDTGLVVDMQNSLDPIRESVRDDVYGRHFLSGPEIRELRKKKGLTTVELGELVGVDNSYISVVEREVRHRPGPELMKKLADVLVWN